MALQFNSIGSYKKGDLCTILCQSYEQLLEQDIRNKEKYLENWKQFDDDSFNLSEVGKCVFVTCLNNKPIGLFSYDPRQFPEIGIIGHNCILPEYRKHGYGKEQIKYLLKIFRDHQCNVARVETGSIDFFFPAQKMYQSLGFKAVGRQFDKIWFYDVIEYEKKF